MTDQLKATQQRTIQYWFVDGLAELGGGVICLLLALILWLQFIYPTTGWVSLFLMLVVFGIAFGVRWLLQRAKEHSTYPRTGYVAYKGGLENKGALVISLVFALVVLVINIYLILQGEIALTWMPAVGGFIFAFILVWAGYRTGLPRLYFLALFCLLAGVGFALGGLGDLPGTALLSGLTGLVMLIFGVWTRRAYLRQAALLSEASDGSG